MNGYCVDCKTVVLRTGGISMMSRMRIFGDFGSDGARD